MGQSDKMESEDNRPKWLLELENRKRKPRLAHEVGAGAPCMTCSTACPGLDLHFWRKICKNCKCSRDDHDVPNDEFPQFDLLFGPSGKPNRKMIVLKVNKKQAEDEVTFEWAPPNTTRELAADYMKALPEDKLPIKGTAGAALRKQQLQRQLPLHDIDHKVCDELSESERKQFEKYLENLKKYVGQGKVMKALGARPFDRSLMTPANATDMNRFSPKHKQAQPELGHSLNLRTPSSFVQKVGYPSNPSELTNSPGTRDPNSATRREPSPISSARMECVRSSAAVENSMSVNSPQGRYHRALANVRNNGLVTSSVPVGGIRNPALNFARTDTIRERGVLNETEDGRGPEGTSGRGSAEAPYNPAVKFAATGMLGNEDHGIASLSGDGDYSRALDVGNNPGSYYATSGTLTDPEVARSASVRTENLAAPSRLIDDNPKLPDEPEDEATAENRQRENSLLAERMLNEALLPPSAVNAADIVGSTLSERGLSLIREKLTSKYSSAREEPVNVQGATRSRGLVANERADARSKRIDQLRRQGAFDKENDRNDIVPGVLDVDHEYPTSRHGDNSSLSAIGHPCEAQNRLAFDKRESNDPRDAGVSATKTNDGIIKGAPNTEPWRQIVRGICDDYLAKPGQSENPEDKINRDTCHDRRADQTTSSKSLRAELSNYGPGNSSLVTSEDLKNPVFPEQARISSGVLQNPVNVDRLRGAMEELSVGQSKSQNCHQCRETIRAGDVVVTAEKANDAFWHPGCFVCSVCNELLADLVYFYYKGKLYCGRDLATLLEIPRCFACDELIFVREYTVAEGHNYHVKHFCCWDCDVPLAGQQYISENDRPLCLPCYQRTYAKTCRTCEGLIAADQQGVAVKNLNFHANDRCFSCATCKKSLLNGKMAIKEDRPFCSKECITQFLNELIS